MTSTTRRRFLRAAGGLAAGASFVGLLSPRAIARLTSAVKSISDRDPDDVARDEDFWAPIRGWYVQSPRFINLESGYYSPSSLPVLDAWCENARRINETASFYMRRRHAGDREDLRRQLAHFAGCDPEELAITRNTTESLNIVLHGLEIDDGDEVLYGDQEYGSMQETLEQRHRRFGTRIRRIDVPRHPRDRAEVVDTYERAVGPDTRVILASQVIYLTGQVLPIREICEMARARGVLVVVDAAHAFAHLHYEIRDLGCDVLAASLHKWLGAPLGTGLLFMKKELIPRVWPLFGDVNVAPDDVRKFEHIGTNPPASTLAIANAIRFHETIGGARKEARLRYLKDYWAERAASIPGVTFNTPSSADQSCALANFSIEGRAPKDVAEILYDQYRIFTVGVGSGVRVAPNLHNSLDDLDRFVAAIAEIAGGR